MTPPTPTAAASKFGRPRQAPSSANVRALCHGRGDRGVDVSGHRQRDASASRRRQAQSAAISGAGPGSAAARAADVSRAAGRLLEAERARAIGAWPEVPSLAADGIPPFALDPTAKGGQYDWRLMVNGTFVNYLGLPQRRRTAWLLLVQEPEPGRRPIPRARMKSTTIAERGDAPRLDLGAHGRARDSGRSERRRPKAGRSCMRSGRRCPRRFRRRHRHRPGKVHEPITRHARISDVTHSAVPPTMNVITTMSHSGR